MTSTDTDENSSKINLSTMLQHDVIVRSNIPGVHCNVEATSIIIIYAKECKRIWTNMIHIMHTACYNETHKQAHNHKLVKEPQYWLKLFYWFAICNACILHQFVVFDIYTVFHQKWHHYCFFNSIHNNDSFK